MGVLLAAFLLSSGAKKESQSQKIARTAPKNFLNKSRALPNKTRVLRQIAPEVKFGKISLNYFHLWHFSPPNLNPSLWYLEKTLSGGENAASGRWSVGVWSRGESLRVIGGHRASPTHRNLTSRAVTVEARCVTGTNWACPQDKPGVEGLQKKFMC